MPLLPIDWINLSHLLIASLCVTETLDRDWGHCNLMYALRELAEREIGNEFLLFRKAAIPRL
jgi:hypothetical protein